VEAEREEEEQEQGRLASNVGSLGITVATGELNIL